MRFIICLCALTCYLHIHTLCALDIDQGLQGFWGFEEGSGNSSLDDSKFDHSAILVNGPTWVDGKIGGALYFNGESSYLNLGNVDRLKIEGSLSLCAWVKLNNPEYSAYTRVISKKYNWSDAAGYELEYNAARNRLALIAGGNNISYALNVDLDSNWHHLAAVLDGSTNTVQLYVDGQAMPMTDNIVGPLQASDAPLIIGRNSSAAAPFIGCIDEVRIHNRALDAETISAIAWTGIGQRVIQWSGYNWLVKNADVMGPGPNAWNDSNEAVWVDGNGNYTSK